VLVLFSAGGLLWLLVQSSFLDLEKVEVRGVRHTRPEDVRRLAGVEKGEPLLLARAGVAGRVERLPWVRRARVSFSLPGTLVITVEERVALAWVRRGTTPESGVAVVDADGRVLDQRAAAPERLMELAIGVKVPDPGRLLADSRDTRDALRIASSTPDALRARIISVAKGDRGWTLRLDTVEVVELGSLTDLRSKWVALEAVMERLGDQSVYLVDLRAPSVPAVREEKTLPTTTTTPAPASTTTTVA